MNRNISYYKGVILCFIILLLYLVLSYSCSGFCQYYYYQNRFDNNHGLRGSASPALTATGFVNGRWQFSTPTESTPLDRSPKKLVHVIMSAAPTAVTNLV